LNPKVQFEEFRPILDGKLSKTILKEKNVVFQDICEDKQRKQNGEDPNPLILESKEKEVNDWEKLSMKEDLIQMFVVHHHDIQENQAKDVSEFQLPHS
jgi:hypothetical protein